MVKFSKTNEKSYDFGKTFFDFYAPNFEEVEEAYWFGPVRLSVTLALCQEPLEIGS